MRVFLALSALAGLASAIRLPPQTRSTGSSHVVEFQVKRDGRKASQNPAVFNGSLINQRDQSYLTSASVGAGARNFTLVLDTGSSDLWVYAPQSLSLTNITHQGVNLTYGLGSVTGHIAYVPVSVGTYTIAKQAVLAVTKTEQIYVEGVLGLGFDSASQIYNITGNSSEAVTPLSSLFAQNISATNTSNFIALDLSRGPDETTVGGAFTISQYFSDYGSVADQPQLPVTPANSTDWSVAVDGVNVNGQSYNVSQDALNGNATAVIDTGTSLALVSSNLSDFIYQNISGARSCQLGQGQGQVWIVPCLNASNVTFQFGGQQYPINPLDLSTVQTFSPNETTFAFCVGAYTGVRNVSSTLADIPSYILGDAFIRNVYTSFNFGNNTLAGNFSLSGTGPSVQFLSKSNDTNATYSEFLTQRQQTLSKMKATAIDPSSVDCQDVQSLLSKS